MVKVNLGKTRTSDGKYPHHGLTDSQAKQMKKNKTCAICGSINRLAVDHCHSSGKIRGILCCNCNRGLGYFLDNPEFLRKAADYLESTTFQAGKPDPVIIEKVVIEYVEMPLAAMKINASIPGYSEVLE